MRSAPCEAGVLETDMESGAHAVRVVAVANEPVRAAMPHRTMRTGIRTRGVGMRAPRLMKERSLNSDAARPTIGTLVAGGCSFERYSLMHRRQQSSAPNAGPSGQSPIDHIHWVVGSANMDAPCARRAVSQCRCVAVAVGRPCTCPAPHLPVDPLTASATSPCTRASRSLWQRFVFRLVSPPPASTPVVRRF